ncbi:MAG: alpha-ketoacid dehydrogenase subunit beta [Bacillota bacterium]|jgi:pyruvate dehydrogenase E1 component beta subunit|nr:alpha-ketoacid dehydrogenase subunit beta [Bacillota bacterium]NLJ03398.1 alpha-ketoacid dehydrogenase subunit beta [Bacillota bacterium]
MAVMNLISAVNHTLDLELGRDESVVVFGEDVGLEGGVFRATVGLQQKYGEKRVFDTPLAESAIIGTAVGMAINGLRPVAEIQFSGFIYPAYNQIISHVARMRNRTRGRLSLPMVIRMPHGGGIKALEHHSESLDTLLGHIPGLKVVTPSTPYDAKGLLLSAIRDEDPVIFLEPSKIYRAFRQEVPEEDYTIPIGKAKVLREGTDVTVVSWGAYVHEVLKAAELLAEEGISAEVIDLRTISPIDRDAILESVKKTGRFVAVHEAAKSFGPGAELIALVNEGAFLYLEAPPARIAGFDVTIPIPRGEHHYFLDAQRMAYGIRKVANY